jgi:hypothetical protein
MPFRAASRVRHQDADVRESTSVSGVQTALELAPPSITSKLRAP